MSFIKAPLLTLVASACLPFIVIIYSIILPFFIKIHKRTEDIREECSALSFEIFSSIRVVVAFGAEERLHDRFYVLLEAAKKNEIKAGPLMGLMISPVYFSNYATFALAFWFGIKQYINGDVDGVGSITVVLFSVVMAVSNLGRIWSPIMAMTRAATASTELFATIDADVPDTTGLKGDEVPVRSDINLDDIYFAYPSRPDVQILNGVSMTFEAGKTTAIVGPSGSGKSTIVGLIERWYDLRSKVAARTKEQAKIKAPKQPKKVKSHKRKPSKESSESSEISSIGEEKVEARTGGRVRIGHVDLADTDAKWWRSQIGLVSQEPFLFQDSIFHNVAYGLSGTPWQNASDEEKRKMVIAACKEAHAHEYIEKLPEGYDSMVGESGIKLSGGQRQRLAIARSIVKQPSILILDEATSAIDVRTERIVQKALDRVSRNRTTIVIAHRLSTIKKADKIIVLRKGELVEQGTHDELLRNDAGVYYGLVNAQKLAMGDDALAEEAPLDVDMMDRVKTNDTDRPRTAPQDTAVIDEEAAYKAKNFFTSFGRLLYEQRRLWFVYCIVLLAAAGAGVVFPLQAWIFANLIDTFTLVGQEFVDRGNFWALMFFVLALGTGFANFFLGWSAHYNSQLVGSFYRSDYLRDILRKRIAFFDTEGHSPGTLTSLLSGDPRQIEQLLGTEMSMGLMSIFNLVGCVIISFYFGWKLSLVGVLTVLPVILLAGFWRIKLEMEFSKLNNAIFEESSQFATEAVGAFRTVQSLIMEDVVNDRYNKLLTSHVSTAWKKAFPSTLVFATSDSIDMLCQALVFYYGGKLMADYEYNVIQFFVIYMAVIQGSQAAGTWFSFAPNIAEATNASNRILSFRQSLLDKQKDAELSAAPFRLDLGGAAKDGAGKDGSVGIEFRDVHFTYKSRNVPVLRGLNIKVEPGQFAALVGASGCGKSTTVSLLERFYDADRGTILVGGQDITKVSTKSYRDAVSLVAQEATLYEGTIRENVSLSVPEAQATDEAIATACSDAQIHEFITSLPDGYNTRLGPKGVQLSGGQRQRLSLARALLRKPRLLLLDEATSSLDSESEKLVQEAIERAAGEGGRTVLAVAHRLATIQKADVIFVLGSGRVLEKGSHSELLEKRGVYWQMVSCLFSQACRATDRLMLYSVKLKPWTGKRDSGRRYLDDDTIIFSSQASRLLNDTPLYIDLSQMLLILCLSRSRFPGMRRPPGYFHFFGRRGDHFMCTLCHEGESNDWTDHWKSGFNQQISFQFLVGWACVHDLI